MPRSKSVGSMLNSLQWMITKRRPSKELLRQVYEVKKLLGLYAAFKQGGRSGRRSAR